MAEGKRDLLDDLDRKILEALDRDARISLKSMGESLGVTHTTMYNHLNKLTELRILKACTIEVDPDLLDTKGLHFYEIHTAKSNNAELNKATAKAYADYLMQAYGEAIIFCSVGDNSRVYAIAHFLSGEQEARMRADLEANTSFVEGYEASHENRIVKGYRLLSYNRFNTLNPKKDP